MRHLYRYIDMYSRLYAYALVITALTVSCTDGDAPTAPTPTATEVVPGALVCPPPVLRPSPDALPVSIHWAFPTVNGLPVDKSSCTPASGSVFGLGRTTVTCNATQEALAAPCSIAIDVSPPALTCPTAVQTKSLDALPVKVSWDNPDIPNTPQEIISCTPVSGTAFPIGASEVTCSANWPSVPTAADSPPAIDECTFAVSVSPPDPTLSGTRFLAFGDSLTEGFVSAGLRPGRSFLRPPDAARARPTFPLLSQAVNPSQSYPTQLKSLLTPAYPTQSIEVINDGISGEQADEGILRLPKSLQARPDVVLLLEGFNDISTKLLLRSTPSSSAVNVTSIATNLRVMVRNAESRGAEVLLATLPPVTDIREASAPGLRASIQALNAEIRRMPIERGNGGIVEVYDALNRVPGMLGADGVHPTAAGYQRMAQVFFQEIVARFDITPRARAFRSLSPGIAENPRPPGFQTQFPR